MMWLSVAIVWLAGIAAATWLVMRDHPWFAFFVLCFAFSIKASRSAVS